MVNAGELAKSLLTRRNTVTLGVLLATAAFPAAALELGLPLECVPGADCWVVRHVDRDPGSGFADHRCGVLGSDGHDGTDFALADARRMAGGVPVLATSAGVVAGVRDDMPDQPPEGRLAYDFGDRNCGNGVLIEHADGWQTQYCHLRRGSARVAKGERVEPGQPLGLVGMSGEANFPHVHLSVRRDGETIDPFTGTAGTAPCGQPGTPLWSTEVQERLGYQEVPIAVVGLTDHVPDRDAIVAGTAGGTALRPSSPALVGYVLAYGLLAGDRLEISIVGPDGATVSAAGFDLDQDAPRATRAAGRRAPPAGWAAGTYRAEARVRRGERSFARAAEFRLGQ
jgi:murein DD-endopeptidase MepM/ murein hydrolase activator NlpD